MSLPVLIVTGVAALILMTAGGFAVWYFGFRSPTKAVSTSPGGENRRLVVTKSGGGQPLHFSTVTAAANEFKPGDQIVIADEEWDEFVNLTRSKNLVITAAEGKRVTWRVGKEAPAVLSLMNAEATRVSGITFAGGDRVDVVVRVSGRSAGLILEDVEIIGGTTAGLELHEADGENGKPVTVRRARFQSGATPGKAAVLFRASAAAAKGGRGPASDEVAFETVQSSARTRTAGSCSTAGRRGSRSASAGSGNRTSGFGSAARGGGGLAGGRDREHVLWPPGRRPLRRDRTDEVKPDMKVRLAQNFFGIVAGRSGRRGRGQGAGLQAPRKRPQAWNEPRG